jgi:predicted nucleic acid-binding protein
VAPVGTHLADKSALARWRHPPVAERLAALRDSDQLATCSLIELELLFSARSRDEFRETRIDRGLAYPRARTDQDALDRAEEVQALLAEKGEHRGASVPDLIIAATAELADLTLLHYDADFDLIASVTGQSVDWVVPRGSVP